MVRLSILTVCASQANANIGEDRNSAKFPGNFYKLEI